MSKERFDVFIQHLEKKGYEYTVRERREVTQGKSFITYFVSINLYEKRWTYFYDTIGKFYTEVINYAKNAKFPLFNIEIKGNEWHAISCDAMFECYTEEEQED
jgi:hypothetical protein